MTQMLSNENAFLLLHLADSALPIGSFAFSSGLESAVKHGFIKDNAALQQYFTSFAEQLISFELPFVCSAFEASFEKQPVLLKEVSSAYEVMLLSPPILKAGRVLGRNWMKMCVQVLDQPALLAVEHYFDYHKIQPDFPVVFGATMGVLNFKLNEAVSLYFYMSLRDQLGALIRLGVAGPTHSHALLQAILQQYSERINSYKAVPYYDAYKVSYLLELAQLNHHKVYSKLFQN